MKAVKVLFGLLDSAEVALLEAGAAVVGAPGRWPTLFLVGVCFAALAVAVVLGVLVHWGLTASFVGVLAVVFGLKPGKTEPVVCAGALCVGEQTYAAAIPLEDCLACGSSPQVVVGFGKIQARCSQACGVEGPSCKVWVEAAEGWNRLNRPDEEARRG